MENIGQAFLQGSARVLKWQELKKKMRDAAEDRERERELFEIEKEKWEAEKARAEAKGEKLKIDLANARLTKIKKQQDIMDTLRDREKDTKKTEALQNIKNQFSDPQFRKVVAEKYPMMGNLIIKSIMGAPTYKTARKIQERWFKPETGMVHTPYKDWRKENPKAPVSEWYKVSRTPKVPSEYQMIAKSIGIDITKPLTDEHAKTVVDEITRIKGERAKATILELLMSGAINIEKPVQPEAGGLETSEAQRLKELEAKFGSE